jgi:hypothetical protein
MNPDQRQQLVQAVAQEMANGADPDELEQALVQKGVEQSEASSIVDEGAAMVSEQQGGGQGQEGGQGEGGGEGMQLVQQMLEQGADPAVILGTIQAVLNMTKEEIQQVVDGLGQMMQQGGQQGQEQAPPEEQAPQGGGMGF